MMAFNPYAADESAIEDFRPEYSMPTRATYEAPSLQSGDAFIDEFGWSPDLKTSATDVPSGQRLGTIPRYDMRGSVTEPNNKSFELRDQDDMKRHAVEDQQAVPFGSPAGVGPNDRRWAPNPRSTPPPENRITQRLNPHMYSFTRPFDTLNRSYAGGPPTGSARTFNGDHFSMAGHRRNYEAVGNAPVRGLRNTYRLEPTPWDTDVVDLPAGTEYQPDGRIRSPEIPQGNRSGRLM